MYLCMIAVCMFDEQENRLLMLLQLPLTKSSVLAEHTEQNWY